MYFTYINVIIKLRLLYEGALFYINNLTAINNYTSWSNLRFYIFQNRWLLLKFLSFIFLQSFP